MYDQCFKMSNADLVPYFEISSLLCLSQNKNLQIIFEFPYEKLFLSVQVNKARKNNKYLSDTISCYLNDAISEGHFASDKMI